MSVDQGDPVSDDERPTGQAHHPMSSPPPGVEIKVSQMATDPRLGVRLRRVAGEAGLDRPLRHPRVQKSGLALAGHFHGVVPTRVQVLGETEMSYLDSLDNDSRSQAARGFFSLGLACVVITRDKEPPKSLVAAAEATSTPLFVSDARTSRTINALHAVLDDLLAPQTSLHGVLVDVYGVGILLMGKSGIGKSECALELVLRGHRLVADDVVRCDWRPPGMVFGQPANLLRHHIEIRGLGVLNIKELFGVTAVRERKRIDVVVRLAEWSDKEEFDRLGIEDHNHVILGTPIRLLQVPVRPGRDMGSILEIAARNELLRKAGTKTGKDFVERLEARLIPTQVALEDQPESVVSSAVVEAIPAPVSSARVDAAPFPGADPMPPPTESSAWIPAVRPRKADE
jgi:HPr kinase/phosphorylase